MKALKEILARSIEATIRETSDPHETALAIVEALQRPIEPRGELDRIAQAMKAAESYSYGVLRVAERKSVVVRRAMTTFSTYADIPEITTENPHAVPRLETVSERLAHSEAERLCIHLNLGLTQLDV